ncbi:MAG: trehalose-6-phosphate synthase [Dehalococcoidia bacterium]
MNTGALLPRRTQPGRLSHPLIVVSNRGPFEHHRDGDGKLMRCPTGGGVATALSSLLSHRALTWIAGPVSETDRELVSQGFDSTPLDSRHRLRFASAGAGSYDLFYGTFANPILWFLQHSLWDRLERPNLQQEIVRSWENGYLPVNEAFADAVAGEIERVGGAPYVMLHDYHLYVAPLFIRDRHPDVLLQHFTHIPWPGPEAWSKLPESIVELICEGLLANDSVSFQTEESKQNFSLTCLAFLPGVSVNLDGSEIAYRGRSARVSANPISVDPFGLRRLLASPEVGAYRQAIRNGGGMKTIVRVDRLDPSKNEVGGFQAFDLLLTQHPEWIERVRLLAFLVPSRSGIPEYRHYKDEVFALIDSINGRYATAHWRPITVFYEENRPQAFAALADYDTLLVNSLADGMNLVAKEGPVLNQRDGVVVLSTKAGAFRELKDAALPIEPEDIEGTAAALQRALLMSPEERRKRAQMLRRTVARHDISRWLEVQMADLRATELARLAATRPFGGPPLVDAQPTRLVSGMT